MISPSSLFPRVFNVVLQKVSRMATYRNREMFGNAGISAAVFPDTFTAFVRPFYSLRLNLESPLYLLRG